MKIVKPYHATLSTDRPTCPRPLDSSHRHPPMFDLSLHKRSWAARVCSHGKVCSPG